MWQSENRRKQRKSDVWNYFVVHPENEVKAVCAFCKAVVSRGGKNTKTFTTSNLKKHLEHAHKKEIQNLTCKTDIGKSASVSSHQELRTPFTANFPQISIPSTSVPDETSEISIEPSQTVARHQTSPRSLTPQYTSPSSSITSFSETSPQTLPKYHKIEEMFEKVKPLTSKNSRYIKITELIGCMICSDLLPFSMVENAGFKDLISYLEPRYTIPSRHTISNTVIPNLYERVENKVRTCLNAAKHISFTTDMWSTLTNEDFMSLTAHFISDNFEVVTLCLEVTPFCLPSHTAVNIAEFLQKTITHWNVDEKVHTFVRDNAVNLVKGLIHTGFQHIPCTAHTLQLVIKDSLLNQKPISDACAKARRIVGHFKHSIQATKLLKDFQEKNDLPTHRLIQDEPTRWDSTYLMLRRLVEQRRAITWLLPDLKLQVELSNSEWGLLEQTLLTLDKFFVVTQNISKQETTISEVIPTVNGLRAQLSEPTEPPSLASIRKDMVHSLNNRYSNAESNILYTFATLLDARFKNTVFHSDQAADEAVTLLKNEITRYDGTEAEPAEKTALNKQSTANPCNSIHDLYRGIMKRKNSTRCALHCTPEEELTSYLAEPLLEITSDPVKYWKSAPFSRLKKAAQKYLTAPSGSVASERLFSTAGLIFSKKRSSLNPEKLRQLVFLNKNVKLLKNEY